MPYATLTDITDLYGPNALYVADRDGDGVADAVAVDKALTHASAEIDSYLLVRYTLPLSDVDQKLVQISVDIALYRLALSHDVLSDEHRKRYEDAIAWLKDVAAGRAKLHLPSAPPVLDPDGNPLTGAQPIVAGGPPRLFSRDQTRDL